MCVCGGGGGGEAGNKEEAPMGLISLTWVFCHIKSKSSN